MRRTLTDSRSETKFENTQSKINLDQDKLNSWIDTYNDTLQTNIKVLFADSKEYKSNCSELESKYRLLQKYVNQISMQARSNAEFTKHVQQHQRLIQEFLDTFDYDVMDPSITKSRFCCAVFLILALIGFAVGASRSSGEARAALAVMAFVSGMGAAICGGCGWIEHGQNTSVNQARNAIKQQLLEAPLKAPSKLNENPLLQISILNTPTPTTAPSSKNNLQNSI